MIYDAEDRPEPGQLREAVAAFRAGGERAGVRPGRASTTSTPREPADADVHAGVLVLVRLHAPGARRAAAADPARRDVEPLPHLRAAPARRMGRLQRDRGRRPRAARRGRGLHRRRDPLDDVRGGLRPLLAVDPPAHPVDQGLHADGARAHATAGPDGEGGRRAGRVRPAAARPGDARDLPAGAAHVAHHARVAHPLRRRPRDPRPAAGADGGGRRDQPDRGQRDDGRAERPGRGPRGGSTTCCRTPC